MNKKVLVTGGNGFIGRALVCELIARKKPVIASVRASKSIQPDGVPTIVVGDLGPETVWSSALEDVSVVVHTAARVHVLNETISDPLDEYRRVNVLGTLTLARQAANAGVERFILLSTIKVNGERTEPGAPFTPDDTPSPNDPYAVSKWEAEQGLLDIASETGMEVVIIRPPLVYGYGPGVKANFVSMMRWLLRGIPLPLGAIPNQRTLVVLDNLVDLIVTCMDHPAATNQIFLAGDGEDLSTTDLLRRLGKALGKPPYLMSVPTWLLEAGAAMLGKRGVAQRLCGSLQVDISKTQRVLNWAPPVSVDEALRKTAVSFKESASRGGD